MNLLVIPVKEIRLAKSRLSPALGDLGRQRLALALAERVMRVSLASPRVDRVLVVSRDSAVLARAEQLSAVAVEEDHPVASGEGHVEDRDALNRALEQARRVCDARAGDVLAVVLADLPAITAEDVTALFDTIGPAPTVILAPAHDGRGLGAVALRPAGALPFSFGHGNAFSTHRDAAQARDLDVVVLNRRGLAFDLDTPEDLALARAAPPAGWVWAQEGLVLESALLQPWSGAAT